jgi:hypothetical protein
MRSRMMGMCVFTLATFMAREDDITGVDAEMRALVVVDAVSTNDIEEEVWKGLVALAVKGSGNVM